MDGTLYYVVGDHLGSTTLVADAQGNEVGRVLYDPYGQVVQSTLPPGLTEQLFTGQRLDSSSGLYYYNARYYDPALGQFTQPDSLVLDPLTYIDDNGHLPPIPILIVGDIVALKAIDYGWTAYDAWQSLQVMNDPNASEAAKAEAAANLAMTAAFEAAEPDDLLPVALPIDDLARKGILKLGKEVGEEALEEGLERAGKEAAEELAEEATESGAIRVRHYTNVEGKAAITESGNLRKGTYVKAR